MTNNTQDNNIVNLISNILVEKIKNRPGCIEYFQWVLEQPEETFTLIETTNQFESKNTCKLTKEHDRIWLYIKNEQDEQNFSEYSLRMKILSTSSGLQLHSNASFDRIAISDKPQTDLRISISELPLTMRGFDLVMTQLGL